MSYHASDIMKLDINFIIMIFLHIESSQLRHIFTFYPKPMSLVSIPRKLIQTQNIINFSPNLLTQSAFLYYTNTLSIIIDITYGIHFPRTVTKVDFADAF